MFPALQPPRQQSGGPILRAALTVGTLGLLVKLAGGVKLVVLAYRLGTSDLLEAFLLAFLLPALAAEVLGGSWSSALVPALIGARELRGQSAAQRLLAETTLAAAILLSAAAALLALGRHALLPVVGSGFAGGKRAMAESLFIFMLPLPAMMGLSALWRAALTAGGRFALAAGAPAATPLLTILLLLALPRGWQGAALVAGVLSGSALELLLVGRGLRAQGYSLLPRWHGGTPEFRQAFGQYWPAVATALLASGGPLVDQAMAASLHPGSLSVLNYGNRLLMLIAGVVSVALSTAVLPHFSEIAARGAYARAREVLAACSRTVLLAGIPAVALLGWLSEPLVRVLLQRGAFSPADTATVAGVQSWYLLQLPFLLLSAVLARMLSALKGNRLLMLGAGVCLPLNVALDYVLMRRLGVSGIALASTAAAAVFCCFLWVTAHRLLRRADCNNVPLTATA